MRALITLAIALLSVSTSADKTLQNIDDLVWKNRLILVWSNNIAASKQQLKLEAVEVEDRDIIWFLFSESDVATNYQGELTEEFTESAKQFFQSTDNQVVLIGKDGRVKERDSQMLLDSLFRKIDRMPMRINEMERYD
ncbi:DUF4174 domain-containing protein [Gilvimarinus sp. SDUM040013]|uniref:DUF4174 domain-containing protein n=1 Tax=Gilvimarinus gilvus TaxID=3058038 RepID=A0ABU4S4K1_9GAMM|nr:DUF4174 domain-containing protein [Gilvimarinus sp. SDUM040013]MDO3384638.1 DUF4174 domain-containing protein [Gilvimarinus sp. SDUM040013]MDX6850224.1 DUF4174 domain-containing protein [Gilvimarinus sp. SDUM040013]